MTTRIAMLLIMALASLRCASTAESSCFVLPDQQRVLKDLAAADWELLSDKSVSNRWPAPITWGSHTAGEQQCTGTRTHSYLGEVVVNECNCCDTFVFEESIRKDRCHNTLTSIVLVRTVRDAGDARSVAAGLLHAVDPGWNGSLQFPSTATVRRVGSVMTQTSTVDIVPGSGVWRVRLAVFRSRTSN